MTRNNKLREININNYTYYDFDDITDINDLDLRNIKVDKKHMENILIYYIRYGPSSCRNTLYIVFNKRK